ncbi:MAG: DNA polymerase III subunit alpha [Pseudomonadota bacterium]|nr:DNA polymerase III subunit alpha [Pseudomonadota bacterium]
MSYANFVHLRNHSAYSLAEGALKIPDLVNLAADNQMPAVAITDSGNLFGALEFSLAARRVGVQPIIGCEISVARTPDNGLGGLQKINPGALGHDLLVLLAQNETGYLNLMKLGSKSYLETPPGEHPRIQMEDLNGFTDGLIALSGGHLGSVGRFLAAGQLDLAYQVADHLAHLFGDRFYIELSRHELVEEKKIESHLIDLAYAKDLPLVATNNCYFSERAMYEAHDALLCIAQGTILDNPERRRLTPTHCFRSAEEMRDVFIDLPEALGNTLIVAQRCNFMPDEKPPILPAFPIEGSNDEAEALKLKAEAGLLIRMEENVIAADNQKKYRDRLNFELSVINQMGFPGYFLIVADFIQWAKSQDIPVGPGRGSGAGSVVAWALTITDLDPLRFGLLFERFLNPERVSMPDFDIDFCQDRRDEVIRYVQGKYGFDRVAQIITFGKLQARAVLRDVGRVLAMPYGYVDKICKLVPFNPAKPPTLAQALEEEPELARLKDEDEQVKRLLDIGMKLEGLYRHASTHAAGVVIGDRPLDMLVPMYKDSRSEMAATQFSMKYAELAGLVKFDFLGLKTLTVISRTVELIKDKGSHVDMSSLALNDELTFEMLGCGDTVGVFQLESAGMRDVLRQLKPDKFEDIIALVALYRPGPMDNIPRYIACKHGKETPDYLHPELEEILKETFGVMIYQEQVMQIAQVLSGYSLGGADLLRRAMGKKIKAEMDAQRSNFVEGAVKRGVEKERAEQIFEQVDKFAGYGFNKSHAAAYALLAYQTAWLKANYPVEFLAASMTLDLGNTDKINVFRQELQRLGIELLPPSINCSEATFGVEYGDCDKKGAIRYALAAIKNVGSQAMSELVFERKKNGSFGSLSEFVKRVGARAANKRMLENLIKAGALDTLMVNRRSLFEGVEKIVKAAVAAERERGSGQDSLFEDQAVASSIEETLPNVADWSVLEKLDQEFDAVGFYLSAHPLDAYGKSLSRLGIQSPDQLSQSSAGTRPKLAGVVVKVQERTSARGHRFAFVQFSGQRGMFEVVVFSEVLSQARDLLVAGRSLLITCEARADENNMIKLNASSVKELDIAVANAGGILQVHVQEAADFENLQKTITHGGSGKSQIRLVLCTGGSETVEIALPGSYNISADMRSKIGSAAGVTHLRDL